ncbi:hypothetical protein ANTPLA_LOCUS865 [Anthophora plagiata]
MNRIDFLKYLVQNMPLLLMQNQLNISIHFFSSNSLFDTMVMETNRYTEQFLNSREKLNQRSRARSWVPVTVTEMKAFVAVLLEMSITKRPSINYYWSKGSRNIQ